MKKLSALLSTVLLSLAFKAVAVIPENGWWWNADESGRGFNIEVQDNKLFLASFGYDTTGAPMWIFSGGPMGGDRDYTGEVFRSTYGQCFGCAYVPPALVSVGTVTLHFTSSQTAVLTLNGVSVAVKRYDFWMNEAVPDGMLGQWSAVVGASGDIFDGERINYTTRQISTSTGLPFLAGNRLGNSGTQSIAVVSWSPSLNSYTALLDSSTSYYRYFVFNNTGFNRVEGSFWLFLKNSQPSGAGTFYQAFRTASAARILTGVGPGSTKSVVSSDPSVLDKRDELIFKALKPADKSAPADVIEAFESLRKLLVDVRESAGSIP